MQESDFFKSFDTDGDGVISFGEYQVILMLLALPLEVRVSGLLLLHTLSFNPCMLVCTTCACADCCYCACMQQQGQIA